MRGIVPTADHFEQSFPRAAMPVAKDSYVGGSDSFFQVDVTRQQAKFSTWLIHISINEAKMKLRKGRRHLYESTKAGQQNDERDYIPKDFADWREIPSEALEHKELRKALTHALDSLPEKYRTVLILRDVQHLSITETA
jgi:RNA polymerase sigma-70 factor (ECF subfamily)